jgi:hypothetical protein
MRLDTSRADGETGHDRCGGFTVPSLAGVFWSAFLGDPSEQVG